MQRRKRFQVYWAKSALLDLGSIIHYLSRDNSAEAARVLDKIETSALRLAHFPHRGRIVPELREQGISIYHEIFYKSWRIVYRIEGARVWILAVIDGRRNLEDLLFERFLY